MTTTLALTLAAATAAAQAPASKAVAVPRLTVRPHEMATGTQTAKGGLAELEGFPGYFVYVPQQCVGTHRSPLVVLLHGGGRSGYQEVVKSRSLADRYGFIVLAPNALNPGRWDVVGDYYRTAAGLAALDSGKILHFPSYPDVPHLDSAMHVVLRQDAIDPEKIALIGFSNGGTYALFVGHDNLDVFSRIGALSAIPNIALDTAGPRNPKTQFLMSGGIAEEQGTMVARTLRVAEQLRHEGHLVQSVLGLRGHVDHVEDDVYFWGWLARSWGESGAALPPVPAARADSDPLLTGEALRQMTDFWTRFLQEPDSIRAGGRMAHQEQMTLAIGVHPVWVIKTDMAAMATTYPSVAADLAHAGLTAAQEEAYRAAMLRVEFTQMAGQEAGTIAHSVLAQNLAFRAAHVAAFRTLGQSGIFTTQ